MARTKKKAAPMELTNEQVGLLGIEYANKKEAIKELESQCKECRKPLEAFIETSGRTLESGSKLAVISVSDVDVHLKKTLRVGKVLLPEALEVIHENGLGECVENVPTIREDVLEQMYLDGKVTDEILKKIYAEKSTYAFSVELKERFKDAPE